MAAFQGHDTTGDEPFAPRSKGLIDGAATCFAIDKRAEAPDGYEYIQTTDYPAGAALKRKARRAAEE